MIKTVKGQACMEHGRISGHGQYKAKEKSKTDSDHYHYTQVNMIEEYSQRVDETFESKNWIRKHSSIFAILHDNDDI